PRPLRAPSAGRARRTEGRAPQPPWVCRPGCDALPPRWANEVVRIERDYRPRQIDSADVVSANASDPPGGPLTLLSNDDVAIAISRRRQAMPYCYRNIDGDLLYFVHRGTGIFATEFGPLHYEPDD